MDFGSNDGMPDCLPKSPTAVTKWKLLPLTSCSTREGDPSTSPGQRGRAGPESKCGRADPGGHESHRRDLAHLCKDELDKSRVGDPILTAKTGELAG